MAILFVVLFFHPSGGDEIGYITSKGFSISGLSGSVDEADGWAWGLNLMLLGVINSHTLFQILLKQSPCNNTVRSPFTEEEAEAQMFSHLSKVSQLEYGRPRIETRPLTPVFVRRANHFPHNLILQLQGESIRIRATAV